ncbi:response regulator transcription factor [Paenibacillus thermotolerans]|uniref:response regulator transcription factor n=1 Tax=Paenibacillus thermotolerans TaxID=3027807 RepID=UPI002368A526|nr:MULTISPECIES: response regulator [unclassified Paenibacillus]
MMLSMLVVDDDTFEREGVKFLVSKYDLPLNLAEADSSEKALQYIASHKIDILLTDIRMNGMDGLDLARKARERDETIKVIIMSAYGEFEYAQRAIDVQAIRYILKPVEVNEFLKVMSQVIQLCEEERNAMDQYRMLEEGYRKSVKYEKQKRVTDLLHGNAVEKTYELFLPMLPSKGCHSVRLVLLDTKSRFFDLFELDFEKALAQVIRDRFDLVHLNPFQSLLFVDASKEKSEDLQLFGETIARWFKQTYDRDVNIVIGGLLDDAEQFHAVFNEIEAVLEKKFFYHEGAVLFVNPFPLQGEQAFSIDEALAGLLSLIQRRQFDMAKIHFEQFIDVLHGSDRFSAVYIKYLCAEIVKAVFELSARKEVEAFELCLEQIYKTETLNGLKGWMQSFFEQNEPSRARSTEAMRKVIEDVVAMIENEYGSDLSLESLAERVYLSPSYLSHLFKKSKGISINKYITLFRMERARHLLLTTNQKIIHISQSVGYANVPYFSSLFKTHFGKTPSQFREEIGS